MAVDHMQCPSCGQTYRVTAEYLAKYGGRTTACQKCQGQIVIPMPEATAHEEPAQAAALAQVAQAAQVQPAAQSVAETTPAAPTSRAVPARFPWGDFLAFRHLATPLLVKIAFWAGTVLSIGLGVWSIAESYSKKIVSVMGDVPKVASRFNEEAFFFGLVLIVVGPVCVRLACEMCLLLFRINNLLEKQLDVRKREESK